MQQYLKLKKKIMNPLKNYPTLVWKYKINIFIHNTSRNQKQYQAYLNQNF
jgi:hypothetical protein